MFTMDNTEGFTQENLNMMNRVFADLAQIMDGRNASDKINNAWFEGITEAQLRNAVGL
jgi:hypothetical protein